MAKRWRDEVGFLRVTCLSKMRRVSFSPIDYLHHVSSSTRTDVFGNTDMHLTTDLQHMRSLLQDGADVEVENFQGMRPIHYAVSEKLVGLIQLLIQYVADVNAADIFGDRPLHEAVCHDRLDVVQLLIQHGAKINVQNNVGRTPLHIAVKTGQSDIIAFLLKEGADVALPDVLRNTSLHYITAQQLRTNGKLREYITKQNMKYDLLIDSALGLPVELRMIPLGILYDFHHINLGSKEMSVNELGYTDCYGNTLLHHVVGVDGQFPMEKVSTDVENIVEFQVQHGGDINARNNDGLTPLLVARGDEAIKACLQHTDLTAVDIRHRNFWHIIVPFR